MNYVIGHEREKAATITLPTKAGQNTKKEDLNNISLLRPSLFWDVDLSKLDMVRHAAFIIVRVMERSRREDVRYIWKYYGGRSH